MFTKAENLIELRDFCAVPVQPLPERRQLGNFNARRPGSIHRSNGPVRLDPVDEGGELLSRHSRHGVDLHCREKRLRELNRFWCQGTDPGAAVGKCFDFAARIDMG